GRVRGPRRRPDRARGRGRDRGAARPATLRDGVPALRLVSAPGRGRERRVRARGPEDAGSGTCGGEGGGGDRARGFRGVRVPGRGAGTRGVRRALSKRVGITTSFVTHEQEEAFDLGDRVAVLQAGRLEQLAMPDELYEHPASLFVATFVGRANVLRGKTARAL